MNSIGIWTAFEEYKQLKLPKFFNPSQISTSSDWLITSNDCSELLIFKSPFVSTPEKLHFSSAISEISCNTSMALLLSSCGEVWLLGEDLTKSNLFGIEGLFESKKPLKMQPVSCTPIVSASLGNTHAGIVCSEGFLYTWGKGNNGELGYENCKSSFPGRVESATIFKAKQVLCGNGFTGICTQGEFLYIFGSGVKCECGGLSGFPYTIPALEEYFVKKAYTSPFGIVVLTDAWKCYIVKGCLCVTSLRSAKKVLEVATCTEGICGLSKDKKNIFLWTKATEKEWKSTIYKLDPVKVNKIVSSLGNVITISGENIQKFPGAVVSASTSREVSPLSNNENERKSFEQLMGTFNFGIVSREKVQNEEGCKVFVGVLNKMIGSHFRKIKEYSYLQFVYRRAYASTFTPSIIGKILQRVNVLDKSFAFQMIYKFAKYNFYQRKKNFKKKRNSQSFECVKELSESEVKIFQGLNVLNDRLNLKGLFLILKIFQVSNKEKYLEMCGRFLVKVMGKMIFDPFEKIIKFSESLLNYINPLLNITDVLNKSNKKKYIKYFYQWRSNISTQFPPEKLDSALKIAFYVSKLLKFSYKLFFSQVFPIKSNHKLKYGLYFLLSCISKIQNKNKSYSFNSIIRQKNRPHSIEVLYDILKIIFRTTISSSFQSMKMFSINKKNKSIIKIILMLQAIQEKIKYRQVIRGYNSFKRCIFNKSMISDFGSEKSFSGNSMFKLLVTPPSESPTFDANSEFVCMTERSNNKVLSTERRASLSSFQQNLIKKFSDKISKESKSGTLKPSKGISEREKNKNKESGYEKRIAYGEALKERQRRINSKSVKDFNASINSKKNNFTITTKKETGFTLNDMQNWKVSKYKTNCTNLAKIIFKLINIRMRLPFNKLKYFITNSYEKNFLVQSLQLKEKSIKIPNEKEKIRRLSKEFMLDVSKDKLNEVKKISSVYESPVESPIAVVQDDNYPTPPSSGIETFNQIENALKGNKEKKEQIKIEPLPQNSWKVKLYALGLNKFSRTFRTLVFKRIVKGVGKN